MTGLRLASVVILVLCGGLANRGFAQMSENIRPFADIRYIDDDNIFRSGINPESDSVLELGVGVDVNMPVSRQNFNLFAEYSNVAYDKNESLDHKRVDTSVGWDWVVGERFSGDLNANYSKTIASFDEEATRNRDDRKDTGFGGRVVYMLTPRWDLVGGANVARHRVDNRPTVDLDTDSVSGEVRYATGARTKVGARYTVTDGDYLNTQTVAGEPFDNDYTLNAFTGTFYWQSTGKSSLNLEVGYVEVEREQGSQFDYDGQLVRVAYTWDATGKTRVQVRVWNQAQGRDEVTGYVVTQGISVKPSLKITAKLSGSLDLLYEEVQHEGDSSRTITGALREDTNQSVSASISYALTQRIVGSLRYKTYDRETNAANAGYDYSRWTAQLRASF